VSGFWRCFAAAAERWRERPAWAVQHRDGQERCSYDRLRALAETADARLRRLGLARGERCAILGENSLAWCVAYLAIMRIGAVAVPLDRNHTAPQAASLIADSGAVLLLASASCGETAEAACALCPSRVALTPLADLVADSPPEPAAPPAELGPGDPAMILYTSGTTADPKGVPLTQDNLIGAVDALRLALPVDQTDSSLGALPFSHILGLMAGILLPLAIGGCTVLLTELNSEELLRATRDGGVTVLCGVPQLFAVVRDRIVGEVRRAGLVPWLAVTLLMRVNGGVRDLFGIDLGHRLFRRVHAAVGPRLRFLVSAGAPLDPAVVHDFHRLGFTLLECYGLTETTGAVVMTPLGRPMAGTVGTPLTGGAVAILSSDGRECGRGEEGEIGLRGRMVMAGYYRRPEATAEAFVDGWFRSGDLGTIDRQGRLRVTGRSKDLVVLASGMKVQPEEVERRLEASPFIQEVCVLGRRSSAGETLHAIVVPDMTAFRERQVGSIAPTIRHEIDTLSIAAPASQRVLSFTIRRADLPRTTTRKIRRHIVREQLEAEAPIAAAGGAEPRGWSAADREWASGAAIARVLGALESELGGNREPHPEDSLELDFAVDSLRRVELVAALERALGSKLADAAGLGCYTVRELVEAFAAAAPAASAEEPAEEGWALGDEAAAIEDLSLLGQAGIALDALRFLVLKTIALAARLLFRLDVRGRENLPRTGPCILAINHQSYLDGAIVLSAVPYGLVRRTVMLGKPRYVGVGWRGRLAARLNAVAIDADANLGTAMRVSARVLRDGNVLLLFPEGERSIDGELRPLRRGAAILACHAGTPIVPTVIDGTHRIWPRGRLPQQLGRVALRFTPPLDPPRVAAEDFRAATTGLTLELQQRLETTLDEMRSVMPEATAGSRVSTERR